MQRKREMQITVPIALRTPPSEKERLMQYCKENGRTQTDVLREYIRSLPLRSEESEAAEVA